MQCPNFMPITSFIGRPIVLTTQSKKTIYEDVLRMTVVSLRRGVLSGTAKNVVGQRTAMTCAGQMRLVGRGQQCALWA